MKKLFPRIYTRSGDKKETGILAGVRLSKHSNRIEAIGSLDELNSFLGFLLSLSENIFKSRQGTKNPRALAQEEKIHFSLKKIVEKVQQDLFIVGSDLSQPLIQSRTIPHLLHHYYPRSTSHKARKVPQISHTQIHRLEEVTDHFQKKLPPLKNFILPQGNAVGSFLQVVRAICRRTERQVVRLSVHTPINPLILAYLNRLSDLLFVLARVVNYENKRCEIIWKED